MTENIENIVKLDLRSFQQMCEDICNLKARCRELSKENLELRTEIADLRFTHNYLTSEEAGKAFARELLGGA